MKSLIAISIFAVAVLILFADVIFGPEVLLDASPFAFHPWQSHASAEDLQYRTHRTDGLLTYLPRQVEVSRSFRSGRLPLWNPYIYAGIPFLADPQTRVFYPTTVLLAWTDPAKAIGYDVAIHVFVAMLGMYLFLRAVGASTPGSVIGALAYGLSSFFSTRVGQPTFVASAAWIPFFFYAYELARTSEREGTLLLTGFLAMGYLAGFPQIFMLGVGGLAVYAVSMNLDRMFTGRPTGWLRSLRVMTVSGICSMLLVSAHLVPFMEFIRNAVGLNISYEKMRDVYLSPPALLLRSLFPDFFGNPVKATEWSGLLRETVHPYNPDFIIYCGIGSILVALGGLTLVRRVQRMRALIVLFLISVGLAMSPVMLKVAYAVLPMFRYSRVARVSVLGTFAVAALAGLTLSILAGNGDRASRRAFVRAVFAALAVLIVGSLIFTALGDSYVGTIAEKASSLGEDFWRSALAQLRSGKLREWAVGKTGLWFAYVKDQIIMGIIFAVLASAAVIVFAWPRRFGWKVRQAALAAFAIVLLFDLGALSRRYFVTQPSGHFTKVDGVRLLKHVLADSGRWRTRSVSYSPEYVSTLPGNANQILKIPSLEGTSTIVPSDYYEGLFQSFKDAAIPPRLRKAYLPFRPEEIRLSDLASVRYVAAEGTQAPYVISPVFRTILEGLAARPSDRDRMRFVALGNDTRLALCQNLNEGLTFSVEIPDVKRLDFAVGFDGVGVSGDSLRFLFMLENGKDRFEFTRGFDIARDGDRWHEASLDVSGLGAGAIKGAMGIISSGQEASPGVTAGWSGMEFVLGDCALDTVPRGYRVEVGENREFADLTLRSAAREVPLEISIGEDKRRVRWVAFPPHLLERHLAVDLAGAAGDTFTVVSDSAFVVDRARIIHLGSVYPDYRLIHSSDMHIYENFAALEKGILIDKSAVAVRESEGRLVLGLAGLDEGGAFGSGGCRIVSYEPERVLLEVFAERDCYLLFQDMYYPGWRAYLDSEPTRFIRADVGLRVVDIPRGDHIVEMEFRPQSLRIGLALSCLGVLLTLGYAWLTSRRAEHHRTSQAETS